MFLLSDRIEAGQKLATALAVQERSRFDPIVLGIPRGGAVVASVVSSALDCDFDMIIVKKLPAPAEPEVGFGAVTMDKVFTVNNLMTAELGLSEGDIEQIKNETYHEVIRRNETYRHNKPFPQLQGRDVVIIDDGLATGYTMLAAINYARQHSAQRVLAAIPVGHVDSCRVVGQSADELIVLHVETSSPFSVGSFYQDFSQVSDAEVIRLYQQHNNS